MSREQAAEIRRLVDAGGWVAVRQHPDLWAVWQAQYVASQRYVD